MPEYVSPKIPIDSYLSRFTCPKCGTTREVRRRKKSAGKSVQTWCYTCRTYKTALAPQPQTIEGTVVQ